MAERSEAAVPPPPQAGQDSDFMAVAPSGSVSPVAPPGRISGQKMQAESSSGSSGAHAAPVLLGSVMCATGFRPPARALAPDQGYSRRSYRIDPQNVCVASFPTLQGIPASKAERKVEEIHSGAVLAQNWPVLKTSRRWQDASWILPFLATVGGVVALAVHFGSAFNRQLEADEATDRRFFSDQTLPLVPSIIAGVAGGIGSLLAALIFAGMARKVPGCVLWTSLVFWPLALVLAGLVMLGVGIVLFGLIFVGLGVLSLACVICCYKPLIPLTVRILTVVTSATAVHPGMFGVALLGSMLSFAWSLACAVVFAGAFHKCEHDPVEDPQWKKYALSFLAVLVVLWGAQVACTVCHVTYCGVFGRWYHRRPPSTALRKSLTVAVTTSLGSICMGSFLIGLVHALEFIIRQARRSTREDGNMLICVVLLGVECVVACLGDILEYFSAWAYVQCAIRGASLVDGARITYSMLACANLVHVIPDVLITTVVNFGVLFCAVVGSAAGAAAGLAFGTHVVAAGAITGFWVGLVSGAAAVGVLSSGAKTILVMWAERPEPLWLSLPGFHRELEDKIMSKLAQ